MLVLVLKAAYGHQYKPESDCLSDPASLKRPDRPDEHLPAQLPGFLLLLLSRCLADYKQRTTTASLLALLAHLGRHMPRQVGYLRTMALRACIGYRLQLVPAGWDTIKAARRPCWCCAGAAAGQPDPPAGAASGAAQQPGPAGHH